MRKRALSLAALAGLAACHHEQAAPAAKPSLTPVKVQRIETQSVSQETAYSANIAPETQITAAFRVGGYVERLLQVQGREVQEGDVVSKGAVLAELRQADFATKVNQAKAQLAQTQAALLMAKSQQAEVRASSDDAQADFGRARNLFASQSLTRSDYEAAQARALAAQAKLDTTQGQVLVGGGADQRRVPGGSRGRTRAAGLCAEGSPRRRRAEETRGSRFAGWARDADFRDR